MHDRDDKAAGIILEVIPFIMADIGHRLCREGCFLRCGDCAYLVHPPTPLCPVDHSKQLSPVAVSGRANVATCTINYQRAAMIGN